MSRTVLVVEDYEPAREGMTMLLRAWGYDVQSLGSLSEACAATGAQEFDVAIIDCRLPDGAGGELAARLRASGAETYLIGMTGAVLDEGECNERFDVVLQKPVDFDALASLLATRVRNGSGTAIAG